MKFHLNNRSLIKVSGKESKSFLQSQFSNDITKIREGELQINTYCQHQGKIIAIIWVFKKNDAFYLSIHSSVSTLVLDKLNMFKMMSDVTFENKSKEINQYGVVDEEIDINGFKINNKMHLKTTREVLESEENNYYWNKCLIDSYIPEVRIDTSELFVPEVLNLDIDEFGVSFTKGCYPGQEVVARMHYLGSAKRRMYRFKSNIQVQPGSKLLVSSSKSIKPSGIVVSSVYLDGESYFLGTLETTYQKNEIFLNTENGPKVILLDA